MGNTPSTEEMTKDELLEYQRKLISQQQEEIKRLNVNPAPQGEDKKKINPYKVLEIGKNYDENSLKKAYLKKALVTHPDRGGTPEKFKIVTICYQALLKKLKEENNSHNHHDLRQHSTSFLGQQTEQSNILSSEQKLSKNFNSSVFNKMYDENRIENIYDDGYDEWIKSNESTNEPQENLFNGTTFNKESFNSVFSEMKKKEIQKTGKQMIRYDEPMTDISYKNKDSIMVLGRGKIDDFSGESGGLAYRDYKDAFTNTYLIDEDAVSIQGRPRNIDAQESERSKISYDLSPEEQERLLFKQKKEEEEEKMRILRLQQEEKVAFDVYDKLHQRMIGSS